MLLIREGVNEQLPRFLNDPNEMRNSRHSGYYRNDDIYFIANNCWETSDPLLHELNFLTCIFIYLCFIIDVIFLIYKIFGFKYSVVKRHEPTDMAL